MSRPTLLFVHGTGVRDASFDASYATIQAQAAEALPGHDVRPCNWGGQAGVKPPDNPASVPGYESGRSAATSLSAAQQAVRWGLLYEDPLYELRAYAVLAGGPPLAGQLAVAPRSGPSVAAVVKALGDLNPSDGGIARAGHLAVELRQPALALLQTGSTLASALAAPPLADPARARPMLARAFVGAWMQAAERRKLAPLDGELRDRLYDDAVAALGGATAGLKDELFGAFAGLASRALTPLARSHRTQLSDGAYAPANDILLYQTEHGGRAIRDAIARHIRAAGGPVVLLAHSLGGIACVELLAITQGLPVTALVTCGSQAPFLYEADVLARLRKGRGLPSHFPRWLNVYDLNDFLSYCAAPVFPGRATDVEVASRQPFPQSHSAYWANKQVWRAVADFLK